MPAAVLLSKQVPNQEVLPEASKISSRSDQSGQVQASPVNPLAGLAGENIRLSTLGITPTLPGPDLESLPPAGRLQYCYGNWMKITSDNWVLESVQRYCLELTRQPIQMVPLLELHLSETSQEHISTEVEKADTERSMQC